MNDVEENLSRESTDSASISARSSTVGSLLSNIQSTYGSICYLLLIVY